MKLIVLGDIHGNLPALEVALREARAEGADLICHTGDLVGYAPFPAETVTLVRDQRIPGVRGDVEESLATGVDRRAPGTASEAELRFQDDAYAWTVEHLDPLTRNYLADLPFQRTFEDAGRRIVVVHATPLDVATPLWEGRDEDFFREMGEVADADILIFGHTHRPYHRVVDGRHFINAGSVGFPGTEDRRTGYVAIRSNGHIEVQPRRFPYDTRRLLEASAARGFPAGAARIFRG
jgi:putative phosphoesterase